MKTKSRNQTVLVAEDHEILNGQFKDAFEAEGFEVYQAFDGAQAKAIWLRERPDLTLVDIQMPKVDGLDALRFIKLKEPRALVVVMTGVGSEKTAVDAMKLGADEYLAKPFLTDDLLSLATRLLEGRRISDENVRLKKRVEEGERYLAHLTRIIDEALITTDPKGMIRFINLAASKMWGYSEDEVAGKDIHFLISGEARTLLYRDLVQDTIKKGNLRSEFHFRRKDTTTFPGYLSTSVIRVDKRVEGIVAVVTDLTRLREVENRLKHSEKLASLGKLAEGIAHEVRNCLTSLGGFARRLRTAVAENQVHSQYTRIILDNVSRLETMVTDIEEYVRFSKNYSFDFRKVDIPELIVHARDRVLERMASARSCPVSFAVSADKNMPLVSADPKALEEAFYNVILNAYEAMPDGGRLKVTVRDLKSAISVSFTDTGVGINDHDLREVFNPFFTTKTTGAGMGLSKVFLLIEEHGGAVNVTSKPGKGTTFEVFLPMERLVTGLHPWEAVSRGRPRT